eukprot:5115127-Amphidinium_carterae.1
MQDSCRSEVNAASERRTCQGVVTDFVICAPHAANASILGLPVRVEVTSSVYLRIRLVNLTSCAFTSEVLKTSSADDE